MLNYFGALTAYHLTPSPTATAASAPASSASTAASVLSTAASTVSAH